MSAFVGMTVSWYYVILGISFYRFFLPLIVMIPLIIMVIIVIVIIIIVPLL